MTSTKEFNRFKILSIINLSMAALLSILELSFHADISLLAFPISGCFTAATVYLVFYLIIVKTDGSHIYAAIKFTEYLPYVHLITFILRRAGKTGTAFWYDVATVVLWFIIWVLSYFSPKCLYADKNKEVIKGWAIPPKKKKLHGIEKIIFEIADWVDAAVWAVFTVLIFQIFLVQLYSIPSESMVPTFLIKDHVFVSKIDCGPKFPLTDVGLPDFRKYKRGDTIVIRNPHYSHDRKEEVKTVTSQLVNMLTLMTVNLNKDADGELKADPLVKRIAGEPGEQLVMQDGKLYRRTIESDEWKPVDYDNKFATWDLSSVDASIREKIQYYPFSSVSPIWRDRKQTVRANTKEVVKSASENYRKMLDFEEERRNYDLNLAVFQAKEIVRKFKKLAFTGNLIDGFEQPSLFEYNLFKNVQQISTDLLSKKGGVEWFSSFMTSWIYSKDNARDYYSEANYRLNVMTKITFGKLVVRYSELFLNSSASVSWQSDSELYQLYEKADILNWYIQQLLDERNMPVFPANDNDGNPQYIPDNCYFMIGDNRFNSLDLRHRYEKIEEALTKDDPQSVSYYSMMEPQFINKKYIIGKPIFRFWPLNRFGKV